MIHSFQLEKLNKNNKQNITLVQFTRQHFLAATNTTVSYNLSFYIIFSSIFKNYYDRNDSSGLHYFWKGLNSVVLAQ